MDTATKTQPILRELQPDLDPVAALRALSVLPNAFFLDSNVDAGAPAGTCDFSLVGADPFAIVDCTGHTVALRGPGTECVSGSDPFEMLDDVLATYQIVPHDELPFSGGAVGYLGYDLRRFVERVPAAAARDLDVPDMFFGLYDAAVIFDHRKNRAYIVSTGLPERGRAARVRARERAAALATRLAELPTPPESAVAVDARGPQSNFLRSDYLAAVQRARDYIFAGDIYQVNLSQRFSVRLQANPVALYERLRTTSPAPFGAYLDAGRARILSNSPERFLQRRGDRVETRPIKGTMPRAADLQQDCANAATLCASAKDAAEHLMIVDLERNDLGRVCEFGSVAVDELARLESYPTVHHLVSTISGRLKPDVTTGALLRATFPGGSITGAPKVRAMQIIDELEPMARGVYTGAIGYLGFDGSLDLNIAIRTLLHEDATAHFQVGGGIVADSDAEAEYQETLDKAAAFFRLIESADYAVLRP